MTDFVREFRIMRKNELIFGKLLGKNVKVEASGYVVEGKLLQVEASEHNGFGNIILESPTGLILIRGSSVQSVSEVREGCKHLQPRNPKIKNGR